MNRIEALGLIYESVMDEYDDTGDKAYYDAYVEVADALDPSDFPKGYALKVLSKLAERQTEYGMRCGVIEAIKAIEAIEVWDE